MCEHEFESLRTADGSFCMTACRKCMKSTGEIETLFKAENRIAAANARVAELEQQQFAGQTWVTFDEHMKALKKIKQMEDAIKFDFERFMEFQQRAEQAEAQCAAYKKALDIAMSTNQSHETYCKVEAALEEKL